LAVFPDKEEQLLWNSEPVPFFMSPAVVKPRADRYTLTGGTIRVYGAVAAWGDHDFPVERTNALNAIYADPDYVADAGGAGGVWQRTKSGSVFTVSVIAKLTILGLLKFSTLDPLGMGVEMEGGKPGWNDAMNGLPGIIGSGMPETYEMLRIIRFVKASLTRFGKTVTFPKEFAEFMTGLSAALTAYSKSSKDKAAEHTYWDASNTAREKYRAEVVATFSGLTVTLPTSYLVTLLGAVEQKTTDGITRALATNNGLSPSYFHYECTEPVPSTQPNGKVGVSCNAFEVKTLPQFLEGPARHMKVLADKSQIANVYERTKASGIYDAKLKMFKLSESLAAMGQDGTSQNCSFVFNLLTCASHVSPSCAPFSRSHEGVFCRLAGKRVGVAAHELQVLPGDAARWFIRGVLRGDQDRARAVHGQCGVRPFPARGCVFYCQQCVPRRKAARRQLLGASVRLHRRVFEHVGADDVRAQTVPSRRVVWRASAAVKPGAAWVALHRRGRSQLHVPRRNHGDVPQSQQGGHVDDAAHSRVGRVPGWGRVRVARWGLAW